MQDNLFDVSKEIVLITGVSGQLGTRYARVFLERGARVVGLDIVSSENNDLLKLDYRDSYYFKKTDITSKSELRFVASKIEAIFGSVTVLINNAAIDSPPSSDSEVNGKFEEFSESAWEKINDVNLKGAFLCCQIFGSSMAKSKNGSIINISSIYGLVSPDHRLYAYRHKRNELFYKPVAYSVTKAGVLNLTRYLATYWAPRNIRVNSLTLAGVFNQQDPDFLDAYCARIPIARMAKEDEFNGAVLFLSSKASSYMTGQNLIIDGGWTAI